ncbi:AAA family ATPase [Curtobacterium sp. Csp1]|uniref:AAA family ATPase n=1 Tax=unclassified Curtobacterium TaxID=257496 RepID=UPI001598BDAA|nr:MULTISPECIES: AAA family ATPase [unclassified Curtobacterium]QKS14104.1 AAA family ATPase [Curtobacterium sp. csp3]QKS21188.1 AAA family ATPase [Curtobacterium sp. Csp1]QKS21688.1 AAA family ATPase [Curtobacterium sp. Csp1]
MTTPLRSISIQGFRSIESLTLDLSGPITLLIGANGAGKSNLVDAFELLGYAVDGRISKHIAKLGGISQLVHRGPGRPSSDSIDLQIWGDWVESARGAIRNGYALRLEPAADDSAILTETTFLHRDSYQRPYSNSLGVSRDGRLKERISDHVSHEYLFDVLSGCRVFHFDDTSVSAPPLRRVDVADGEMLHDDARNLAAVLLEMRENSSRQYDQVVRSVRNIAPFFDDFVLRPRGDTVLLRWRERGLDDVLSGSALSSGTLRFICLAVLLQQPRKPSTIILDEPELGLHPAAIHQLAALFRNLGPEHRLIAATQSVTLLGQFGLSEVAVVERSAGSTVVMRPNESELQNWLQDYSVGELWEMNLLGGRPTSSPLASGADDD